MHFHLQSPEQKEGGPPQMYYEQMPEQARILACCILFYTVKLGAVLL